MLNIGSLVRVVKQLMVTLMAAHKFRRNTPRSLGQQPNTLESHATAAAQRRDLRISAAPPMQRFEGKGHVRASTRHTDFSSACRAEPQLIDFVDFDGVHRVLPKSIDRENKIFRRLLANSPRLAQTQGTDFSGKFPANEFIQGGVSCGRAVALG
jgi:hypothetical protein